MIDLNGPDDLSRRQIEGGNLFPAKIEPFKGIGVPMKVAVHGTDDARALSGRNGIDRVEATGTHPLLRVYRTPLIICGGPTVNRSVFIP